MGRYTKLRVTLLLWNILGARLTCYADIVSRACSMTYLPKIDSMGSSTQVTCQGAPQPTVHLTCKSSSCKGTSTCKSCTEDLTHAYVSSVECVNYDAGESGITMCKSSGNESYTCTGSCSGYATCSDCILEQISTPAGPASTGKSSGGQGISTGQVTTWLAWR